MAHRTGEGALPLNDDAVVKPVWRSLDLTDHVVYLADVLVHTIRDDMRSESRYLRSHAQARAAIKEIAEMPDLQFDRIIRSVTTNQGRLSNVLSKEIPFLKEPGIWEEIVQVVERAFDGVPGPAVGL